MIWCWPSQFAAGHLAREIVEAVDFSATLCALAELPPLETSDGKDLSELMLGKHREIHTIGVTENVWSKSVRMGRYRYVHYVSEMFPEEYTEGGYGELYDLQTDPWEMHNLYFKPEFKTVVREIQLELMNWLITTTRPATVYPPANWKGVQAYNGDQSAGTFTANTVNKDGKVPYEKVRVLNQNNPNYV